MKPWLWIPPKLAHDISPYALNFLRLFRQPRNLQWKPLTWRGLQFQNPIGISGGIDKNASTVQAWWTFGAGFIEIGTVTPKPQGPNENGILERDCKNMALWNFMGFPNVGVDQVASNLANLPKDRRCPLFANIGKNRDTANENATKDYVTCIKKLSPLVDAFVINISSPNTKDLRDLLKPQYFEAFLSEIIQQNQKIRNLPLLLKLSPDLSEPELETILLKSASLGISGWVLTNTTRERSEKLHFPKEYGGVSGRPLSSRSRQALESAVRILGPQKRDRLLIASGGILEPQDIRDRLALGADLVQVYTALVFHGPGFFRKAIKNLGGPEVTA